MRRRVFLALISVGLALLVWFVWPRPKPPSIPAPPATSEAIEPGSARGAASNPDDTPEPASPAYRGPRPARLVRAQHLGPMDSPLVQAVAELQPLAEAGDPIAAYRLGLSLYACRDIPDDEAGLAAQIGQLYARGYELAPDGGYAGIETRLRSQYAHCAGVSPDQRRRYHEWIRNAARDGLLEAQVRAAFYLPPDLCAEYYFEQCSPAQQQQVLRERETIAGILVAARDAGSADALWQLGAAYLGGELLQPDDIRAYGYLRAMEAVLLSAGEPNRVGRLVAQLGERLRAVEREQGEELALELLNNPNCCVLLP